MSRFQPSDRLMIKTNALQLALACKKPNGIQTADQLLEDAKKIEAYLLEADDKPEEAK